MLNWWSYICSIVNSELCKSTEGHSVRSSAMSNSIKLLYFILQIKCEVPGRSDFTLLLISNPAGSTLEIPIYGIAIVLISLCLLTSEVRNDETKSISAIGSINITPALLSPPLYPGKETQTHTLPMYWCSVPVYSSWRKNCLHIHPLFERLSKSLSWRPSISLVFLRTGPLEGATAFTIWCVHAHRRSTIQVLIFSALRVSYRGIMILSAKVTELCSAGGSHPHSRSSCQRATQYL